MTIGEIMKKNHGVGPGFDALRIVLAFCVIFRHSFPLSYGWQGGASSGFFWSATNAIVPAFFAVSGFLVMGSAQRLVLGHFALSRTLRIVPALVVDTLITVLLIGTLFTTMPLRDYFSSSQTYAYLLNIVGIIHYFLPGVFEANSYPGVVNGSLWTIKPELGCYVLLGLLMYLGVHGSLRILSVLIVVLIGLILVNSVWSTVLPSAFSIVFGNPGALLVPNFLLGGILYLLRDHLPYSKLLFLLSIVIIALSGLFLPEQSYASVPTVSVLLMPAYAYLALFIGATRIPRLPLFSRGDYSYGVYLYGFPVQQSIVAGLGVSNPFVLFALTVPVVTLLAIFSWHLVEKPTLRFRKFLPTTVKSGLERDMKR
jgi:peptidoglycan/LPS O-acetylase OafA/YrhL